MDKQLVLVLALILVLTGCTWQRRLNAREKASLDHWCHECMAKHPGEPNKCTYMTYPSCEQTFNGCESVPPQKCEGK